MLREILAKVYKGNRKVVAKIEKATALYLRVNI